GAETAAPPRGEPRTPRGGAAGAGHRARWTEAGRGQRRERAWSPAGASAREAVRAKAKALAAGPRGLPSTEGERRRGSRASVWPSAGRRAVATGARATGCPAPASWPQEGEPDHDPGEARPADRGWARSRPGDAPGAALAGAGAGRRPSSRDGAGLAPGWWPRERRPAAAGWPPSCARDWRRPPAAVR